MVTILAKDEEKQKQIREKSTKDAEDAKARSISAQALTAAAPLNPSTTSTHLSKAPTTAKLPASGSPQPNVNGSKPAALTKTSSGASTSKDGSKRISMFIQAIPPFKGKSTTAAAAPTPAPIRTSSIATQNGPNTPLSPGGNRLNVNASSFKPINKVPSLLNICGPFTHCFPEHVAGEYFLCYERSLFVIVAEAEGR